MRNIFVLIYLLVLPTVLVGQQGRIKGKVLSNGAKIEYAQVIVLGTSKGGLTDSSGQFDIGPLEYGKYTVRVNSLGYFRWEKEVLVSKEKSTIVMDVRLTENERMAEEVVITGTMKESFRTETITPVEVYSPKFFQKNPSPNLFYALQNINGVQPQLQCAVCNTGDIHINGMEGPYTLILIDGMPIVSSLSTVYGLMGIPNVMVDRIEIIKGPASTLYGSEAVAGIINIITKDPAKAQKLFLDLNTNTYQEYNLDLMTKTKIGKVNMLFGGNYFNYQSAIDKNKDNFTDMTLQNRGSFFMKANFNRKHDYKASIGARLFYEDRWGGETRWTKKYRNSDTIYGESIYTKRLELFGNYQLPIKTEKVVLNGSYNYHNQNSVYGTTLYLATQHTGFAQLVWEKKLSLRNELVTGATFRYTAYKDNTPATRDPLDSTVNIFTNTYLPGLFFQNEYKINERHKLLIGTRYDYHNVHGNIFSPRMGYKWNLNKYNYFRFNIGNGFRVVNLFTEDHAALSGSRKVEIVGSLLPEKSWNGTLTYTNFLNFRNGFLNTELQAFYTYFTNKIQADYDTDPNKIIYKNLDGHAISRGVSANFDASFVNGFKIMIGATAMSVFRIEKNELGKDEKQIQVHAPKFQGTFTLSYLIPKLSVLVDYTGVIYGPQRLPIVANDFRPEYSPIFSLQNIQLSRENKKGITFYGGVKNILNFLPKNPIYNPQNPFSDTFDATYNYAPNQGIRLFVGVRVAFK